nr:hybrid pks-nrps synthetase [Quercus suber]
MLIGYHQINTDDVSFQVLLNELELFNQLQHPTQKVLQYPDTAGRQRYAIDTDGYDLDTKYWREDFSTLPDPLPLFPFAKFKSRTQLRNYASSKFDIRLEPALVSGSKKLAVMLRPSTPI